MMGGICNQKFKSTVCHKFTDREHRWGWKRENGETDSEGGDSGKGKEDNTRRVNCKGMTDGLRTRPWKSGSVWASSLGRSDGTPQRIEGRGGKSRVF